jgi:MoxR-like ATPase
MLKKKLNECLNLIPEDLKINKLNWKLLNYAILKGKNVILYGPSRTGKTKTIFSLKNIYSDRKFFNIPMGSTQDARSSLIGNTHYNKEKGTFTVPSYFVQAIQTQNAIILLDEITRASIDAERILMSVLDEQQRFLRIDEDPNTPLIHMAEGVSILATANIGNEYTSTRELDKAFKERFIYLKMDILSKEEEIELNQLKYPKLNNSIIQQIVDIAEYSRQEYLKENMNEFINSKQIQDLLDLIDNDFSFDEAVNAIIKNKFNDEDYIKINQFMEKYDI